MNKKKKVNKKVGVAYREWGFVLEIITNVEIVEYRRTLLRNIKVNELKEDYNNEIPFWLLDEKVKKEQLKGEKLEKIVIQSIQKKIESFNLKEITIFQNYIFDDYLYEIDILLIFGDYVLLIETKDWLKANDIKIDGEIIDIEYNNCVIKDEKTLKNNKIKLEKIKSKLKNGTIFYNVIYINNKNIKLKHKNLTNNFNDLLKVIEKICLSISSNDKYNDNLKILKNMYQKNLYS